MSLAEATAKICVSKDFGALVCFQFVAAVLLLSQVREATDSEISACTEKAKGLGNAATHSMFNTKGVKSVGGTVLDDAPDGSILGIARGIFRTYADHVMIKINGDWCGVNNPGGHGGLTCYPKLAEVQIFGIPRGKSYYYGEWGTTHGIIEDISIIEGLHDALSSIGIAIG